MPIHSFTHQRTLRLFAFVDWNAHCDLSSVISNPGSRKRLRQCHSQSRQLLLISSDQCQHCNCYSMQPTPGRMHRLTAQHKQDFSILKLMALHHLCPVRTIEAWLHAADA